MSKFFDHDLEERIEQRKHRQLSNAISHLLDVKMKASTSGRLQDMMAGQALWTTELADALLSKNIRKVLPSTQALTLCNAGINVRLIGMKKTEREPKEFSKCLNRAIYGRPQAIASLAIAMSQNDWDAVEKEMNHFRKESDYGAVFISSLLSNDRHKSDFLRFWDSFDVHILNALQKMQKSNELEKYQLKKMVSRTGTLIGKVITDYCREKRRSK